VACSTSCPITLPRHARSAICRRPVGSSHTIAVCYKWSTGLTQHFSRMSAYLVGHDGVTYPHVSQALVSGFLKTRERALETCEPSQIGRSAMLFFIHDTCCPLRTTGRVAALKLSRQGGGVQSRRVRSDTGAHLSSEVRFGVSRHVTTSEPTSTGR
jgi:hypothetical protein